MGFWRNAASKLRADYLNHNLATDDRYIGHNFVPPVTELGQLLAFFDRPGRHDLAE